MDYSNISECRAAPWLFAAILVLSLLTCIILSIVFIWLYCRIFSKAGYCWALGLLMLVPIVNVVMLCILALGDWPVLIELRGLKQQAQSKPNEAPVDKNPG